MATTTKLDDRALGRVIACLEAWAHETGDQAFADLAERIACADAVTITESDKGDPAA